MVDDCGFLLGEPPSEAEFGDASSDEEALAAFRGVGALKPAGFEEEVARHLRDAQDCPTSSQPPATRRNALGPLTPPKVLPTFAYCCRAPVCARRSRGHWQKLAAWTVHANVLCAAEALWVPASVWTQSVSWTHGATAAHVSWNVQPLSPTVPTEQCPSHMIPCRAARWRCCSGRTTFSWILLDSALPQEKLHPHNSRRARLCYPRAA